MAGRIWSHREIALLVDNKQDIPRIAKLLGRTEGACRGKLKRLGISIKKGNCVIYLVFPQVQIDRRKRVMRRTLPRLKMLLEKIDESKDLTPKTINELARIVLAVAALLNAVEKWATGEETLEIWKGEVERALEDTGQTE